MSARSKEPTGWVGWIFFASVMMMIAGFFQIIDGLTAILKQSFFLTNGQQVVLFDIRTWGWVHLIMGIVVLLAGIALMRGSMWARIVAVIMAVLSLIANMAFLPTYPVWSIAVMVFDVLVLYAVTVHGSELQD